MIVRTWHVESVMACAALGCVALLGGNHATEWLGASAVWLSFMHGQVSDRMAERQARLERPDVHCWRKARAYFLGKELLWVGYFVAHRSWSALVGCGIFLAYPAWRAWYRSRWPVGHASATGEGP